VIDSIVTQTNLYVAKLKQREHPPQLHEKMKWPPKWVLEWTELTEAKLWQWFACLLYISQHKTAGEEELWSKHWFWERPGMQRFMPYKEFQQLKSVIHFQGDDEPRDIGDGQQKLILSFAVNLVRLPVHWLPLFSSLNLKQSRADHDYWVHWIAFFR